MKTIIFVLLLGLVCGCTYVRYGQVTYISFLTDRKLETLGLQLQDGTQLNLKEYTSEQATLAKSIAEGVAAGLKE